MSYLEKRRNLYYAVLTIPEDVREKLGKIPAEPTRLKRLLSISTEEDEIVLKEVLAEFFPGGRHETLDNYLDEVSTRSKEQSDRARKRWDNKPATAKPTAVTSKANPQQELGDDPADF